MYTQDLYKGINVNVDCLVHISSSKNNHFYITDHETQFNGSTKLDGICQIHTPTTIYFCQSYIIMSKDRDDDTEYEIIFGLPGSNFSISLSRKTLHSMLNIIEGKNIDPIALCEANLSEHGIFPISIFSYIYKLKYYEEGKEYAEVFITSLHSKGDYSGYIFQKKSFRQRSLIDFTCSIRCFEDTYHIEIPYIKMEHMGASITIEISKEDMTCLRQLINN